MHLIHSFFASQNVYIIRLENSIIEYKQHNIYHELRGGSFSTWLSPFYTTRLY